MSKLNIGRLLFFTGLLMGLTFSLSAVTALLGGVLLILGLIVLFSSRDQAAAEYSRMEKAEIRKREKRARTEKERLSAGLWGDWESFTQLRIKDKDQMEFRSTVPACMLMALILLLAGADALVFGLVWPETDRRSGITALVLTPVLFLAGRGVNIYGKDHYVEKWLGWVYKPVFKTRIEGVQLSRVEINRKLGPKPGEADVGRDVSYPLLLVTRQEKKIHLKNCVSLKEAGTLGKEISGMLKIPLENRTREKVSSVSGGKRSNTRDPLYSGQPANRKLSVRELKSYVEANINELADLQFPDNRGLEWTIKGFSRLNDRLCVEVEPGSDEAGYPKFLFVIDQLKNNMVDIVVVYGFEQGKFRKLSARYGFSMKYPGQLDETDTL
ncbi:MAG: hypothetical protein MI863_14910 [Desulfobacterales bacterium]|nr:hypothetical protein [Desulfobacterales bacterium]